MLACLYFVVDCGIGLRLKRRAAWEKGLFWTMEGEKDGCCSANDIATLSFREVNREPVETVDQHHRSTVRIWDDQDEKPTLTAGGALYALS